MNANRDNKALPPTAIPLAIPGGGLNILYPFTSE